MKNLKGDERIGKDDMFQRWHIVILGLALTSSSILLSVINADGHEWDLLIYRQGQDLFMDFFNHIQYCSKRTLVYYADPNACFPPLAYCFYYAAYRMLPAGTVTNFRSDLTEPYGYVLYVLCCAVIVVFMCTLISEQIKDKYSTLFAILIEIQVLLSYSFVYGIERGNSAIAVVVILMGFLNLRESEDPLKKELALLLLAIAAGIKIYPAVFGALYLVEKRYSEAFRLTLYGVTLFVLPFSFFGGKAGFLRFIKNQAEVQSGSISVLSIQRQLNIFFNFLLPHSSIIELCVAMVSLALILLVLFCIFKTRSKYVRILMITSLMVLFPLWSGEYTMCYYLIPMLIFINRDSCKGNRAIERIESSAYIVVFSTITIAEQVKPGTFCIVGCYLLFCMGLIEFIMELKEGMKEHDNS